VLSELLEGPMCDYARGKLTRVSSRRYDLVLSKCPALGRNVAVLNELLEVLMCEPCFDTLRTHDQLGYDVSCSYRNTTGCVGFRYTPGHLNELP
jgi:hypothetical protein